MTKKAKRSAILALTAVMSLSATGLLSACGGGEKDPDVEPDAKTYTYHTSASANPTTWNPHTWENNTDSQILNYTGIGLYDVQLNADNTGYDWVCEMAAEFPVDVTSQYVGRYGVSSGDVGKVWKIVLNDKATWDDGTKIDADDYIYSMKELLNPKMLNRRSDSYTGGTFSVFGASKYLYSVSEVVYKTLASLGYESIDAAIADGADLYINAYDFWNCDGSYTDAEGNSLPEYVSIADETVYDMPEAWEDGEEYDALSGKMLFEDYRDRLEVGASDADCLVAEVENENLGYAFEGDGSAATPGVGVFKTGEYEITIALESEIDEFNSKYNLSSNWLVKEDVYEKCKTVVSDSLITTNYCTTLETSPSYGPYKLTAFVRNQYFTMNKNENWYGYTDGKHEGQFQTDVIDYQIIQGESSKSTLRQLFMQGKLEDYGIDGSEMKDYGTSKYLYSEPDSYTYQFFMNSDFETLSQEDKEGENHSVLSVTSFRKAMSFAISRAQYCSSFKPAAQPGFGVINTLYVIDPLTGKTYRETEEAKKVSLVYAGFVEQADGTWKDYSGETYANLDDAYEAITGYDVNYAKELFRQAYDEAKKNGIYKDGDTVVIDFGGVGAASENVKNMLNMFNEMFAAALPEGTFAKVELRYKQFAEEAQYWEALMTGKLDLSLSAWGGSAFDPWGIIYSCYIDPNNSNNYKFDELSKKTPLTIEVNGTEISATMYDWANWLNNGTKNYTSDANNIYKKLGSFVKADTDVKVKVLAAVELAQLNTACNIPIFYNYSNALKSAKYNNGSDTYVNAMIGFGGIRHITYNYSDAEWEDFVKAQGGNLESFYKA